MTSIKVTKQNGYITELKATGHAGCGAYGEDIVCAGVSSIIQTAMLGLMSVVQIDALINRDEKLNTMIIKLPENLTEEKKREADIVLQTMLCGLTDLHIGYSDFIELEVTNL